MCISEVRFETTSDSRGSICVVENFSDQLKELIRRDLQKVCHGAAKAEEHPKVYSYKRTINEFIKRYDKKAKTMQIGMLGELLCHILMFNLIKKYKPASPYFNLEEANIKKGFDVIVSDSTHSGLCIAEVKSGEIGKSEKDQKLRSLIDLAKSDLTTRLSCTNNDTIWFSAVNNINAALKATSKPKPILVNLLHEFILQENTVTDRLSATHVILVPVLFEPTTNPIELSIIRDKLDKITKESPFASCTVFAVQKSTLLKLESFLRAEGAA